MRERRGETHVLDEPLVELVPCAPFALGVVLGYVLREIVIFLVGEVVATADGEYMRWRSDGVECCSRARRSSWHSHSVE